MSLAIFVVLALTTPVRADPINAVIGDVSWTTAHATAPDRAGEVERIRAHLSFVHAQLSRVTGLPPRQQERRTEGLAALARYIARGEFPRRTDDTYPGRRPRFIDDRGVHCAVGQLIADSGSPALARAINREYEYAFVRDMQSPALVAWAVANGFTIDELATIQPGYKSPPTEQGTRGRLDRAKDELVVACAPQHAARGAAKLHVVGDHRGRATATTASSDPFVRCVAEAASKVQPGGGAYDPSPQPYAFDITLQLATPQQILERRVRGLAFEGDECAPRSGEPAREVTIDVSGGSVRAVATPNNAEVERCVEDRVRAELEGLVALSELKAHRTVSLATLRR